MIRIVLTILSAALLIPLAVAQPGSPIPSNGTDGILDISGFQVFDPVALGLDADGDNVYHFQSINLRAGSVFIVKPEKMRRTGPVVFLVSGDVTISGSVSVSGIASLNGEFPQPGPGGFPGGHKRSTSGYGPGAGRFLAGVTAGTCLAAYATSIPATASCAAASSYGSPALLPLIGGSGSAGTDGTRGGGGAIRISAGGTITQSASPASFESGRGAIHLQAPTINILSADRISADRIRIDRNGGTGTPVASPTTTVQINPLTPVPLPTNVPELRVVSVNGVPVPANAAFSALTPDVSTNSTSAVQVIVSGKYIPAGTAFNIEARAAGDDGSLDRTASGTLTAVGSSTTDTQGTLTMTFGNAVYYILARAVW